MKTSVEEYIAEGGVGVLATDTLYGLVGRALDQAAVTRLYQIKGRRPDKPMIILIADYADLYLFEINLTKSLKNELERVWPGPVSVILPCPSERFFYLHRGTQTLAFRLPAKKSLRQLLAQTGPLVAPSANPEGQEPSQTIAQARAYFGDSVDFYQTGPVTGKPSKLIQFNNGQITLLRD